MIYAIDMDGVIVNSRIQVLIDVYNAYREIFRHTKLFNNKRIDLKNYEEILEKNRQVSDNFKKLTVYAKSAGENVFVFYLIDKKIEIKNDSEFRAKLSEISKDDILKWHSEFYKQRYIFQNQEGWQKIIKPFPDMIRFIKRNISNTIILSNKDLKTIRMILKYFNVDIKSENIFSQEITIDKNKKLELIRNKLKIDYKDIIFIDDNFMNLRDAKPLGAKCYMASWGVNNEMQINQAKELGIDILKLKDLESVTC